MAGSRMVGCQATGRQSNPAVMSDIVETAPIQQGYHVVTTRTTRAMARTAGGISVKQYSNVCNLSVFIFNLLYENIPWSFPNTTMTAALT